MSQQEIVPFCVSNKYYYDLPDQLQDDESRFREADCLLPPGWSRNSTGLAIAVRPAVTKSSLPNQGWKIHVSATPSNAEKVLKIVWNYCLSGHIAFKFLRSIAAVKVMNSKYWSRSASGKFITIYTRDEPELTKILDDLATPLSEFKGPYILTDLRYGEGPLHVRYGAFSALWIVEDDGQRHPAIISPDGTMILDNRNPVFSVPDFVELPIALRSHAINADDTLEDFPYQFSSSLHYSNGGGVYRAQHVLTSQQVVIREARPHAGLDSEGCDATSRLSKEYSALLKLSGLNCVPQPIEYRKVWEHDFLVETYVEGSTLLDEIIRRYPLVHFGATKQDRDVYASWVMGISSKLRSAVQAIHNRGVSIGDIHPSNIIISRDGDLTIVDFECSGDIAQSSVLSPLGAPGFAADKNMSAVEADMHSLRNVELMMLTPIVPVTSLCKSKRQTLVTIACDRFPDAASLLQDMQAPKDVDEVDTAAAQLSSIAADWTTVRNSLVSGIVDSGSPDRVERLFPGDPLQFSFGGATFAYGAAGVLYALHSVIGSAPADAIGWLVDRAIDGKACLGRGFYNGPHGIAYVLHCIGETEVAMTVLENARSVPMPSGIGLFGGQSGIALNLLHFSRITGRSRLFEESLEVTEGLLARLEGVSDQKTAIRPGLLHGATGPALLFLRMHEATGDTRYLDAAERALQIDLKFGSTLPDGAFHIKSGSRYLVYLDGGSAGIGLVLANFLALRNDPGMRQVLKGIQVACRIPFALQPGLFQGKASQIAFLAHIANQGYDRQPAIEQVSNLAWHSVNHNGNICFPGSRLIRLSSDLATGSAGVLLASQGVFEGGGTGLPFL